MTKFLILLVLLCSACARVEGKYDNSTMLSKRMSIGIVRFIDLEADVVCYNTGQGIFCLPCKDTALDCK